MITFQTDRSAPIQFFTRLLLAAYLIEAGLVLIVMPWTPFWLRNYFAHIWPWLGAYMSNDVVRGAVTGIGLITAVVGFRDLVSVFANRRTTPTPSIDGRQL